MRKISAIGSILVSSVCIVSIAVAPSNRRGQSAIADQSEQTDLLIAPILAEAQSLKDVAQVIYSQGTQKAVGPAQSLFSDEDAQRLSADLLPVNTDSSSSLNFETLPNFLAFLSETFSGTNSPDAPFFVPPIDFNPEASSIRFHEHDLKATSYFDGSDLARQNLGWHGINSAALELLLGLRRGVTDAATDTGLAPSDVLDAQLEAGSGDSLRRSLEAAPGGGKYWTEDPDAAWW